MFEGRWAVVTGAASGIGRAVACGLAEAGCGLRLIDVDYAGLTETAQQAKLLTEQEVHCHKADVTDPPSLQEPFAKAEFFGGPDVVVHCAGVRGGGILHEMDDQEWQRVIQTNLTGSFNVARIALESMCRTSNPGSLVFVSSMTGMISNGAGFHNAHYAASKAGVNGMVKALAIEYAPFGIRVNAVCPGPVVTPMTEAFRERNPELYAEFFGRIPLGPGRVEDIVAPVLLLASARWITGTLLMVDGGYTAQ
jgi:NAD(P)-dependent dehydrogenase (short-subunit alcohol dehydrogenase family)